MLLASLRRILTPHRRYLPEIDGVRFVAITSVILFHLGVYAEGRLMMGAHDDMAGTWVHALLDVGCYGVEIFFVVSGFLLALPFAEASLTGTARPDLKRYFLRRLTRLEPPFLLSLLALFAAGGLVFGLPWGREHLGALGASLIYQYQFIFGGINPISAVAWSLEVEVAAYALIPLATLIFTWRSAAWRRGVLVVMMIALPLLQALVPAEVNERFHATLPWYIEYFAAGFLLADLQLTLWKEPSRHAAWWDLAVAGAALLLVATLWRSRPGWSTPMLIAVCIAGTLRGRWFGQLLRLSVLTVIGGMCYSLYLLHYPVISAAGRLLAGTTLPGTTYLTRLMIGGVVLLPVVLLVSALYFVVIERPCMRPDWPSRLKARFFPA